MSDFIDRDPNQVATTNLNSERFNPKTKKRRKMVVSLVVFALLIIGGVSAMLLFRQNQDTRNQASVANGLINAKLKTVTGQTCVSGQTCQVDVVVNTGSSNIDALQLKIAVDPNSLGAVSELTFIETPNNTGFQPNAGSKNAATCMAEDGVVSDKMLRYCTNDSDCPANHYCNTTATIQTTGSANETSVVADARPGLVISASNITNQDVQIVWTLGSPTVPFNTNNRDHVLGKLQFKVNGANVAVDQVKFNIDQTFSKATLYKTGEDSLNTPSPLSIAINPQATDGLVYCKADSGCAEGQYCYFPPSPNGVNNFKANSYCKDKEPVSPTVSCRTNADCKAYQTCYQPPMPVCPEGRVCPQVAPSAYCLDKPDEPSVTVKPSVTVTSTPTPTPTKKPSATPTPTKTPTPTPTAVVACPVPDCRSGILRQLPNEYGSCPVYVCVESTTCQYTYSEWSSCNYGVQTRSVTSAPASTCKETAPVLKQECTKSCTSDTQCATGEYCDLGKVAAGNTGSTGVNSMAVIGACRIAPQITTDLNGDGITNVLDLSMVIKNLFAKTSKADVNKDGIVDISDYSLVLKSIIGKEFTTFSKQ